MKVLSIIGLIIGIGGLAIGLYCQFQIVPYAEDYSNAFWNLYHEQKMLFGNIALFAGGISFILGIISGIKKKKLGWIVAAVGLVSTILGLMQATHIF